MSITGDNSQALQRENEQLRAQLEESQETLRAIREGEVDALVISGPQGERVFTLQSAEQPYRLLIEQMREGAVMLVREGAIHYANAAFADMVGRPLDQVIGSVMRQYVAPTDQPLFDALLQQTHSGTSRGEVSLCAADGRLLPVYLGLSTIVVNGVLSICLVATDLAEQKRTQQVMASEEMHRVFFDLAAVGMAYVTPDQRIVKANEKYSEITGYTRAELLGMPVLDLTHPDDRETDHRQFERYLRGQQPVYTSEKRYLRKDGTARWVAVTARTVHEADGRPRYSIGIVEDITERKRQEEDLLRLNRTLRALSNSNQAMMRATDETEYVREVCAIVVQDCGHAMAWVGYARQDEGRTVEVVAHAGAELGYLQATHITWADAERGRGPTGTAIRTGDVVVCNNMLTDPSLGPWREEAAKRGYAASISLPLLDEGRAFGALMIYSSQPAPFSEEEVTLLRELASDLAHGIMAIRLRAAHAQATESLRRRAEELQQLLDVVPAGVWVANDPHCLTITGNRAANELYEVRSEENMSDSTVPDARRYFDREGRELAAGELPMQVAAATNQVVRDVEVQVHLASNGRLTVVGSAVPLRDEKGAVRGCIGAFIDITERKRAEDALRFLAQCAAGPGRDFFHELARYLAESLAMDFVCIDTLQDGRLAAQTLAMYFDGKFEDNVSYTLKDTPCGEVVGKSVCCFPEGVRHQFPKDIVLQNMMAESYVGTTLWSSQGQPIGLIAVIGRKPLADTKLATSILQMVAVRAAGELERRQAEEALAAATRSAEQAKAAAEHASKAKDHFLAVLSHELRNPLNPVLATAAMLRDDPRFDADTREQLEVICRNVELEARLIDDLLDVTRIERGKVELDRRPIDLRTVIERAVEVCRPDIVARQLHFGVDIPDGPCLVDGDAARLQQVFWNLLKNAIKFTPQSGCVGIRCRRDGDGFVVAEVNDSGVGMEPDALGRIFNAFEQAERSITQKFGGLGLGLTISKAMVEMHGGHIAAHSPGKGQGATFTVRLPLLSVEFADLATAPTAEAPPLSAPMRPLRILLVEDHGDTARIMCRLLMADGHEIQLAGDVATALKLTMEHSFDLLLSDLGLPDGSGLDLMRAIRAKGLQLPAIALSGYGQEKDVQQTREAGFAAHLVKPISLQKLEEAIGKAVGHGTRIAGVGKKRISAD